MAVTKSECKDCEHGIFDERWGEYKCSIQHIVVPELARTPACDDFKKRTGEINISKNN